MDNRQPANHSNQDYTGHERRDVPMGPVIWFLAGLAIFMVLSMVALGIWFRAEENKRAATDTAASAVQASPVPNNAPQLEADPAAELDAFLAREHETLTTYGWVDKNAGIGRIPIDRAMELALKQGFPVREGQ